jgi:hypothetical protein
MLHGDAIEGCFVAIQTFVPKIVLVASMSLPFAAIVAAGFRPSECTVGDSDECKGDERAPEPQSDTVKMLILTFFCVIPTAAALVSIYFKLKYGIKEAATAAAISDARAAHSRGEVAVDPLTGLRVGPLCVSRVSDARTRKALMALAHFSEDRVKETSPYEVHPFVWPFSVTQLSSIVCHCILF